MRAWEEIEHACGLSLGSRPAVLDDLGMVKEYAGLSARGRSCMRTTAYRASELQFTPMQAPVCKHPVITVGWTWDTLLVSAAFYLN